MEDTTNAVRKLFQLGRRELVTKPVDTGKLLARSIQTMTYSLEKNQARVTTGELPVIETDPQALELIFDNLLTNAVKFLDPKRPGVIEVTAERSQHETLFHVHDNGRGIAAEDVPRAFELFRRVGELDVPGEGIGLAHVKILVQRLGGDIWCKSAPGEGSTFSFSLPKCHSPHEKSPKL